MQVSRRALPVMALVLLPLACARPAQGPSSATPAAPATAATPAPAAAQPAVPAAAAPQDSLEERRQRAVAAVLERIRGRENEPAEQVFDSIRAFRGVPAERMVRAMGRFGGALGVTCGHCHVRGNFASEEKPEKQIARDMMAMVRTINDTLLARIPDLKSDNPSVGCTTCHRGQPRPGVNPAAAAPARSGD
ncbi:MAG TPA: c-type cytochrome [Longimicrobium sp.]|nr:c-type cytochrome [Longimicrobium sp.]